MWANLLSACYNNVPNTLYNKREERQQQITIESGARRRRHTPAL